VIAIVLSPAQKRRLDSQLGAEVAVSGDGDGDGESGGPGGYGGSGGGGPAEWPFIDQVASATTRKAKREAPDAAGSDTKKERRNNFLKKEITKKRKESAG